MLTMTTLAQTPQPTLEQPLDLLNSIPELEQGIPAEALEPATLSPGYYGAALWALLLLRVF